MLLSTAGAESGAVLTGDLVCETYNYEAALWAMAIDDRTLAEMARTTSIKPPNLVPCLKRPLVDGWCASG